jgi:hypothetical protein
MDSEEPPNVRVACSGDIDEVVRLMHDAAAWMGSFAGGGGILR